MARNEIQSSRDADLPGARCAADEITKRLKQLAFFDIRKLYNSDGSLKRIVDLEQLKVSADEVVAGAPSCASTASDR